MDIDKLLPIIESELSKAKSLNITCKTEDTQKRVNELKDVKESFHWLSYSFDKEFQQEMTKVHKIVHDVLESNEGWKIGRTHDGLESRLNTYKQKFKEGEEEFEYVKLIKVYDSKKFNDVEAMEVILIFWFEEYIGYELHNKTMEKKGPKPKDADQYIVYIATT